MPDGRLAPEGTARAGVSTMAPYDILWGNITILPWLEFSGRYTRIEGVSAFGGLTDFGYNKDKAFDLKVRLLAETEWLPALAYGRQDFHGTGLFEAQYIAASKSFSNTALGTFDLTAGYGSGRIDGWFGGVRWQPPGFDRLTFLAEYDGIDYQREYFGQQTGRTVRDGGLGLGIEYRRGYVRGQLAHQDGKWGLNLSVALPLQQPHFVPRLHEPDPIPLDDLVSPPIASWSSTTPEHLQPLFSALRQEGFQEIVVGVSDQHRIGITLTHPRYSQIGQAVGRAARVVAAFAPPEATGLDLTFIEYRVPVATWRFDDLGRLRDYFDGRVAGDDLQDSISVSYVDARAYRRLREEGIPWESVWGVGTGATITRVGSGVSGFPITVYRDHVESGILRIQPVHVGFYFNDPNGAFKFDVYSSALYTKWLGDGLYISASARMQWWENVSDTIGTSNSLLPRVRSDIARYRRDGSRFKLSSAYISHLGNPTDRVYTWASAGILEEMFAGVGGEILYLPEQGNWGADFSLWGVRQRDYKGHFGFFDYQTVTAIGSFHYRLPSTGLTFTTRAGRFLARDHGVRFEVKRRFLSGFEVGAWYSHTDAKDITSPGSPQSPYRDKGVFVRIAVGPFLTRDTNAAIPMSISPWARDPGQMLIAPGGLYDMFERRLMLNLDERTPWTGFGR